jgi:hypothetical protein
MKKSKKKVQEMIIVMKDNIEETEVNVGDNEE